MTDVITEYVREGQFCAKMERVMEDWRKLHIQELYGSDQSPNLIRIIKSRRLSKAEYDERTMEHFVLENTKERFISVFNQLDAQKFVSQ